MKKLILLLTALVLTLALAGCSCEHQWQEATCDAPKICALCGETEGEALTHIWQDATCTQPKACTLCALTEGEPLPHNWVDVSCAAPKHCSSCDLTEGEALAHTWQEANYQQPQTCTVCSAEEGNPLPAYFETNGLECSVEADTSYTYHSCTYQDDNLPITATLKVSNYKIFESDSTHAAKEGYEWRSIQVEVAFDAENAMDYGIRLNRWIEDYYGVDGWKESIRLGNDGSMTYNVNYLGEEKEVCCVIEDYYWSSWDNDVNTFYETMYFHVPVGYDGVAIAFLDASTMPKNAYSSVKDLVGSVANENSLFFRLA